MFAARCVFVTLNVEYISVLHYTIAIIRFSSPLRIMLIPLLICFPLFILTNHFLRGRKWNCKMSNTNDPSLVHSKYCHFYSLHLDAVLLFLLFLLSLHEGCQRKANVVELGRWRQ
jgi:hypothetical protein